MPDFRVYYNERVFAWVEVEAENADEAIRKVERNEISTGLWPNNEDCIDSDSLVVERAEEIA